ncbi:hypothetical protein DFH07DRAFT_946295 [Mycena maculata]|uniref:Uncharacterized protein n=1 Tax=Mycena maculata TaxID=230809 RepID=A0AAD7HNJ3_9AGAR|nr:hypothetical protein DFH07DRAFT_946295 [Mycena maculata]
MPVGFGFTVREAMIRALLGPEREGRGRGEGKEIGWRGGNKYLGFATGHPILTRGGIVNPKPTKQLPAGKRRKGSVGRWHLVPSGDAYIHNMWLTSSVHSLRISHNLAAKEALRDRAAHRLPPPFLPPVSLRCKLLRHMKSPQSRPVSKEAFKRQREPGSGTIDRILGSPRRGLGDWDRGLDWDVGDHVRCDDGWMGAPWPYFTVILEDRGAFWSTKSNRLRTETADSRRIWAREKRKRRVEWRGADKMVGTTSVPLVWGNRSYTASLEVFRVRLEGRVAGKRLMIRGTCDGDAPHRTSSFRPSFLLSFRANLAVFRWRWSINLGTMTRAHDWNCQSTSFLPFCGIRNGFGTRSTRRKQERQPVGSSHPAKREAPQHEALHRKYALSPIVMPASAQALISALIRARAVVICISRYFAGKERNVELGVDLQSGAEKGRYQVRGK